MSPRPNPAQREPQDPGKPQDPSKKIPQRLPPRRQRDPSTDDEIPERKAPARKRQGDDERKPRH